MKPLPHQDAATLRRSLPQIRALVEQRNWSAAYESLGIFSANLEHWRHTPEFGEWCLLRAQAAVELGRYREAVDVGREAYAAFQSTADNARIGLVQTILGRAYLGLGDSKNARIQSRDALGTYRRLGDERGMAKSHNELARIHFLRGEYKDAAEHLADGIELYRQLEDHTSEARLLGNLGRIHLLAGRWSEAESTLTEALGCAEEAANETSAARNLLSLAFLTTLKHEFDTAVGHLESALAYIERAGLARERAIYHEYAGWWHYEQRHWIQAKESFRRALNIGRRLSTDNDLVSQSLRGVAECDAALGDWPQAERLAAEGLEVAIAIGERSEVGCLYRVLAVALAHLERNDEAQSALDKAFECLRMVGDVYELARSHVAAAEVHGRLNPKASEAVVAALEDAAAQFKSLGASDQLHDVYWRLVDAHRSRGNLDDALQLAQRLGESRVNATPLGLKNETLQALAARCIEHATSGANEYRLEGMTWSAGKDDKLPGDSLQKALDFYRQRLSASRVVLIELAADGKRCGRALVHSGATDAFADHIANYVANPYQRYLPADSPRVYWSVESVPDLAASLTGDTDTPPHAVLSVPVELGPGSSGMLYADAGVGSDDVFNPRDVDFAVAFAEIIAWHSTRLRSQGLFRDVQRLKDQLARESEFPNIITQNAEFRKILQRARLIVDSDVSVLLQGETGTGKDLLAKAIHYASNRRDQRFVSVNCAALPESLLESELFGVRRGAYTGADRDKTGLFEEADGGTFFLDEIGEMPLSIQVKLLRFLESKELTRLGDTKPRRVDVRVISATNRDLTAEVENNTFRQDLYYRLSPVTFVLPPLRDRAEDIPLLIDHFSAKIADEEGRRVVFSREAVRLMSAYHWPGNVRELDNEIRKLTLLSATDEEIGIDRLSRKFSEHTAELQPTGDRSLPESFSLYDYVAQIEQQYIARALEESDGVKKHAAQRLGIPESTLRLKMKQYDIT
jgi:transcriptional regulator with GAF, ATPase, and Fis domain/tetratricopeptide (TPR) repeat protein